MHRASLPVNPRPQWTACAFELSRGAANEIQLVPAGSFRASDGRPLDVGSWYIDAAAAARIIAAVAALNRKLVIDYEHQTLLAEDNGQPAPAAGWFKTLVWREGVGLFATDVEWNARAQQMIAAGEYKYISPVFSYDAKTGVVNALLMASLTNYPALDGMAEVLARVAAKFNAQPATENPAMELLKKLLAAMGLPTETNEADALSGVASLKTRADVATTLETEVAALKAQSSAKPDPAKYVSVETMTAMQTEVAALRTQAADREINETVTAALAEGKLLPAQEPWARDLGKSNLAALKVYITTAQPMAALMGMQTGGVGPAGGGDKAPATVAAAALKYQGEQAAAGNNISTVEAVNHVSK